MYLLYLILSNGLDGFYVRHCRRESGSYDKEVWTDFELIDKPVEEREEEDFHGLPQKITVEARIYLSETSANAFGQFLTTNTINPTVVHFEAVKLNPCANWKK